MKKYNETTKKFDKEDDRKKLQAVLDKLEADGVPHEYDAFGIYVQDSDVANADDKIKDV